MVLHDSHAEVLALRGLNHFLLLEVRRLLRGSRNTTGVLETPHPIRIAHDDTSTVLESGKWRPPFEVHPSVQIYLFCTEPPCGDASMDTLIASKDEDNSKPWTLPKNSSQAETDVLHGRGYFSELGIVRRKPSRADAEPTLSKSCTDKLALRQFTGLLSFPTRLFIRSSLAAYLHALVLPVEKVSKAACDRAFGSEGRLKPLKEIDFAGDYAFRPFDIKPVYGGTNTFAFTKPTSAQAGRKPGNVAAVWTAGPGGTETGLSETIIRGVKQGYRPGNPYKASALCRRKLWELGNEINVLMHETGLRPALHKDHCYTQAKAQDRDRYQVKKVVTNVLGGWTKNAGDDAWSLHSGLAAESS